MIYAYAICEPAAATPSPPGRGLGGARLRALQCGSLAAVYSRHRSLRAQPAPAQVLRYERVIETIMARGPVLPFRFGTQLEGEDQLEAVLTERAQELSLALERARGRVELGLRVIPERIKERNGHVGARTGRDALLARVEEHQRALRVAAELHAPLARLAVASTMREFPRPPAILVASYLVEDEQVALFRRQADRLAARQDEMRILVTGPWPPYSFTAAEQ